MVIEGPAGCGKSELLEALAQRATVTGAVVLRAAALRTESALPLGVMRQLVDTAELPPTAATRLRALLDEDEATAEPHGTARAARMQRFCAALHDVARSGLVLIGVDDLQHVDDMSLQYLLYIIGRSRSTWLMTVLTEVLHHCRRDTKHRAEFLRQPDFQRIRLGCLDRDGVTQLLAGHAQGPDHRAAERFHAATGGNPLLLRALLDDAATICGPEVPQDGETFAQAVLTCLERSGPLVEQVADGLAVLGDSGTPDSLSRLCRLPPATTAQALRALRAAGVVDDHRFRHPAARAGVLDAMDPGRRRELHASAAALLYSDGAPAAEIAPHLRAAHGIGQSWEVSVLRDAAEEVLTDDRDRLAIEYLDLAGHLSTDTRQRVAIRIRTAVIMRRNHPSAAEEIAEELLGILRDGRMAPQQYLALADLFVGNGRIDEAREALAELRELTDGKTAGIVTLQPSSWVSLIAQQQQPTRRPYVPGQRDGLAPGPGGDPAEELLERSVLTDSTLEPVTTAVKCLMFAGKLERARHWCELFAEEARRRDASGWYAMFAGIRADIAMHQGNLADADRYARSGLGRLTERKSSVLALGLTALQVMAQTAMGDYEAGARKLDQPAAESLSKSFYGLMYLRARGHHNLATNRLNAALDDFLSVAHMTRGWGFDQPAWVPWRTDMAEVLLRLGERAEAERLITEQLSGLEERDARVRGISLRLLASTAEPGERLALLTRAVWQLQIAGDRLELARALYDLGQTHRQLGDGAQTTLILRRAWQLARECGAEPLCARMRLEHDEEVWDTRSATIRVDTEAAKLSDSEKRVAVLAACGYTNRDISSRLYITVSTVEQHLTRVYRKLKIGGRQQLPVDLQFEVSEIV